MLYYEDAFPSVRTASREVATFARHSCRALSDGRLQCAALGAGRYTWAHDTQ